MLPVTQSPHLRYGFALLAVLVTLLLQLMLSPWIALENSCLLLTAAVLVSAWYGRLKTGIFATAIAALVSGYFLLEQNLSLSLSILEGGIISWLVWSLYWEKQQQVTGCARREKELLEALSSFQRAAQVVNCVIYEWDLQNNTVKRTQGLEELLGYSPQEAEETVAWWQKQIHPDDLESAKNKSSEALTNPKINSFEVEYRVKHKNNYYLYVVDRGMIIRNTEGKAIRVTGCTLDFSQRKQLEISLQTAKEELQIKVAKRTIDLEKINQQLRQEIAERRESEQRYQTLAEVSPVAIFRTNAQGDSVYVNERWCEMTGLTIAQTMGTGWVNALHPEDRERVFQEWNNAVQTNLPFRSELRFLRPDGVITWVFAQASPQRETTGEITGYVGSITDITQRKLAEIALQESVTEAAQSLKMLRMVVSNTPTILYAIDKEGVFTLSEGKGLESLGLKPGEVVGKSIFEVYNDHPSIIEYTKRVLTGEETTWLAEVAGKWFETHSAPLRNEEGKIFGLMGIATEITKRKQAEEALQESESRFRQIAENINEVFYLTDLKQFKIIYVSPAYEEIWGRSCQSLYENSTSFIEAIHPEDREQAIACFHRKYDGEETQLEYRIIRPDGTMRWIWDRCFLVKNEFGEVYRICGVAEDITERKQAQAAILRINEELEKRVQKRTAELRSSEELFRTSVENMLDCFGIYSAIRDEAGKITDFRVDYVNTAACANNFLSRELQIGRGLCEILPGHRESGLFDEYVQVIETKIPLEKESVFYEDVFGNQPMKRVFDIRIAPLGDGFVATWRDITDRKQAQEELYRREQEFKALVENSPDMISRLDTQLRHLYVNPVVERVTGRSASTFIGKTISEMGFPEEKYKVWETALLQVLALGQEGIMEFDLSFPDVTKKYYESRLVPEFASDGSTQSVLAVTRDITELKETEAALIESESKFRRLFESNIIGVIFANISGEITEVNDAFLAMMGYTRQEFQQKTLRWPDITPPEIVEMEQQAIAHIKTYGFCPPYEKEYIRKDGTRLPILVGVALLEGSDDHCVCIILDLTERKKAEEERAQALIREQEARKQAEAASRTKDEFLAIVSHELRSPLNAILGWARLLRSRKLDEEKTNKALETIERNAQAQTQLIEDLLDISRIIRGQVRLYCRPINLVQVIEAAIDTVRPTAETKMIQVESQLDAIACMVFGDPDRLQQIVWNLLTNAVKFTPEGGRVEVKLKLVKSFAQIQVTDTGKGISPDFLPYVFERFRQAESTTTRQQGGLGLGLAIVRNLVELHGGIISVESQGEGLGATFTVQLPLLNHPEEFSDIPQLSGENVAESVSSSKLQGLQVLIVDDEVDTRDFLVTALEQFGAKVTAVESAQEAIKQLQQGKPDVLLSDIGMPIEDGYSLIRRIRALSASQGGKIPAAALTAYAREEDRILALKAGFQLHVAKPIEPLQLFKVVADLATRVGNG
jgi:PAS domain S-box-containing protein